MHQTESTNSERVTEPFAYFHSNLVPATN